jgi:Trypsin-co-occurring domain 1
VAASSAAWTAASPGDLHVVFAVEVSDHGAVAVEDVRALTRDRQELIELRDLMFLMHHNERRASGCCLRGGAVEDTEFVELELPEGGTIAVRAQQVIGDGAGGHEGPTNVGVREALSFSTVSSAMQGVAAEVHRAIETVKPDAVQVEFGFELALKGSRLVCLLADGDAKATIKVRLEWGKNSAADGQ